MTARNLVLIPSVLVALTAIAACPSDDAGSKKDAKPAEVEAPADSSAPSDAPSNPGSPPGEAKCGIDNFEQVQAELAKVSAKALEQCKASGSLPTDGVFGGDKKKFSWAATTSEHGTTYEVLSATGSQTTGLQRSCDEASCTCGPLISKSLASEYQALEHAYESMTLHRISGSLLGSNAKGAQRLLDRHATDFPNGELASVRERYRRRLAKVLEKSGEAETSDPAPASSNDEFTCGVEGREGIEKTLREMTTKAIGQCKAGGTFPLDDVFAGDGKKFRWMAQSSDVRAIYEVQQLDAPSTSASGLRQHCYNDGCTCEPPLSKSLGQEYSILEGALKQLIYKERGGATPVPADPTRLKSAEASLDRHAQDFSDGALRALRERYRKDLVEAKKEKHED